jgi:hypothetical protein
MPDPTDQAPYSGFVVLISLAIFWPMALWMIHKNTEWQRQKKDKQ